ncbi:MAG: hypothetical protein L0I84_01910 [Halomonas subglaciescola]|nr:hypothetical protein [Halomonas subglaciescola]
MGKTLMAGCWALMLWLGGQAAASPVGLSVALPMQVIHDGLRFRVPAGPLYVAHPGGGAEMLILKYSHVKGADYITFANELTVGGAGCAPEALFQQVIKAADTDTATANAGCDEAVAVFQTMFARGRDVGVWAGDTHRFYYFLQPPAFIFRDARRSFVFITAGDGSVVKMESDFLDKPGFRRAVSGYLP